MPKHRFIRKNFDLSEDELEITDRRLIHQISNVLRMDLGDKVGLCDGSSNEVEGRIKKISKNKVTIEVLKRYENNKEPQIQATLFCSILKNRNFEWVVEKATEVGISKIVPIISERTVKTGVKPDRLKKKIREASELSERGKVPNLKEKIDFKEAINITSKSGLKILFDHSGQEVDLKGGEHESISVFVGPEGGWSDSELEQARKNDIKIVKLGDMNLRAETAAVVGSYEVLN